MEEFTNICHLASCGGWKGQGSICCCPCEHGDEDAPTLVSSRRLRPVSEMFPKTALMIFFLK